MLHWHGIVQMVKLVSLVPRKTSSLKLWSTSESEFSYILYQLKCGYWFWLVSGSRMSRPSAKVLLGYEYILSSPKPLSSLPKSSKSTFKCSSTDLQCAIQPFFLFQLTICLLPAHASEQGNVIGSVRIYIQNICVQKKL